MSSFWHRITPAFLKRAFNMKAAEEDLMLTPQPASPKRKVGPKPPDARVKSVVLEYRNTVIPDVRSTTFADPEYDLSEVARAADTESIIMHSFLKHETLMMKEGYDFMGRNPEAVNYIYKRVREAEIATSRTFFDTLRQLAHDLIWYSNAFLVLVRSDKHSSGNMRSEFGVPMHPIVGWFVADPTSMKVKRDKHGNLMRWKQEIDGRETEWPAYNVIHFTFNRKSGYAFGTPFVLPALDDARMLRRLEELEEIIHHKLAYPLFHYQVGDKDYPAEEYDDGTSEVDLVRRAVEDMPFEGAIVTPGRHNIEVMGAKGAALDLTKAKEYNWRRVVGGVNLSTIDMGDGSTSNRGTAQVQSQGLMDRCKYLQFIVSETIQFRLFDQMLLEGGYDVGANNRVNVQWAEIDLERAHAIANNAVDLWLKNAITHAEARARMGVEPMDDSQWEDTFWSLIEKWSLIISAGDEPYTEEAKQAATGRSVKKENVTKKGGSSNPGVQRLLTPGKQTGKGGNAVGNKNRPQNQFQRKASAGTTKNDVVEKVVDEWREKYADLSTEELIQTINDRLIFQLSDALKTQYIQGLREGMKVRDPKMYLGSNVIRNFQDAVLLPTIGRVLQNVVDIWEDRVQSSFDAVAPLLHLVVDRLPTYARAFGYMSAARFQKSKTVGGFDTRDVNYRNIDGVAAILDPVVCHGSVVEQNVDDQGENDYGRPEEQTGSPEEPIHQSGAERPHTAAEGSGAAEGQEQAARPDDDAPSGGTEEEPSHAAQTEEEVRSQ